MAAEPRKLPTEHFPKLQALLRHLLPEEAGIGRAAVLADEALREHVGRVLHEPGEDRMAAGQAPSNAALQRQQVDPMDPLADLDA